MLYIPPHHPQPIQPLQPLPPPDLQPVALPPNLAGTHLTPLTRPRKQARNLVIMIGSAVCLLYVLGVIAYFQATNQSSPNQSAELEALIKTNQPAGDSQVATNIPLPPPVSDAVIPAATVENEEADAPDLPPEVPEMEAVNEPEPRSPPPETPTLEPPVIPQPIFTAPSLEPINIIIINQPLPEPGQIPPPADEPAPLIGDIDAQYPLIIPEIKQLANDLGFTNQAKVIFYNHDPEIVEDIDKLDLVCNRHAAALVAQMTLGCWTQNKIYILRSPHMHTTATHEFLHATFYEEYLLLLSDHIKQAIDMVATKYPQEVIEILKPYQAQLNTTSDTYVKEWIEYNELYAFMGTQFRDIPEVLEALYQTYFKDRQVVVDYYDSWHTSWQQKVVAGQMIQTEHQAQYNEYIKCYNDQVNFQVDCSHYLPKLDDYIDCLVSYQTTIEDCQIIKPIFRPYEANHDL